MNPDTEDKTYLRVGKSTTKTGTQRTFNITSDRFEGDDFQDFACGHAIKYGKGQKLVVPYVYFSMLTGKGEQGQEAIIVNSDGSGDAGVAAEVDIDIMCSNSAAAFRDAFEAEGQTAVPVVPHPSAPRARIVTGNEEESI